MIECTHISAKVDYAVRALCGLADSEHAMTATAWLPARICRRISWKAF
jgi:hypothetical protein